MLGRGLAALCVLAALGASATGEAGPQGTFAAEAEVALAWFGRAPTAPSATPLPLAKPAPAPAPTGPQVVRQCTDSRIVAVERGGTMFYRAAFDPGFAEAEIERGCTLVQQGCNTCSVIWTGCALVASTKCGGDEDCLKAASCERRVVCTAKTCEAEGRMPGCDSRLATATCLKRG